MVGSESVIEERDACSGDYTAQSPEQAREY